MRTKLMVLLMMPLFAATASAQRGAAAAGPVEKPRTMDGINTVWIEELTQPEFRYLINEGYTTVLIMTGGVEDNSTNLVMGKHNINNKLLGDMIARKMGKTLVAPLVTLEPGNAGNVSPGRAGPMISQATYRAVLYDMGNYLRSMGFKQIFYLGDSGGNSGGMRGAADSLTKVYTTGNAAPVYFKHIAEYYNHTSHIQPFIQNELKIAEGIRIGASSGTSGLHEEIGIDATMALLDPSSIRFEQRVKMGNTCEATKDKPCASINGIKFESLAWLQDIGRKVADLRAKTTIDAINAYRATLPK